jgi:hypothetical protein
VAADRVIGDDGQEECHPMQPARRRTLAHRHPGPSPVEAARLTLTEIGAALETAIVIRSVEGIGPVRIDATFIYGRVSMEVVAEGQTESAALKELARKAIRFRAQDQQWFLRYGLGAG